MQSFWIWTCCFTFGVFVHHMFQLLPHRCRTETNGCIKVATDAGCRRSSQRSCRRGDRQWYYTGRYIYKAEPQPESFLPSEELENVIARYKTNIYIYIYIHIYICICFWSFFNVLLSIFGQYWAIFAKR